MEYHKQGKSKRIDRKQSPRYTVMLKIQFILEHYAIIYAARERENIHVQTKSKDHPKTSIDSKRKEWRTQMRSGKRRTSHEYAATLYTVLQFKIILPSKRIIHLLKTYSSCRFTQFPNKHLRHLPFLHEHFRDISVLSDKPSAVDNQRSEAVDLGRHMWP